MCVRPRVSADGESQANMTNLAIKGIIGVKAMAEISRAVGIDTNAQLYDVRRLVQPAPRIFV